MTPSNGDTFDPALRRAAMARLASSFSGQDGTDELRERLRRAAALREQAQGERSGLIGGLLGAVPGFFLGGPTGAMAGFNAGKGLAGMVTGGGQAPVDETETLLRIIQARGGK